jgi:hypothetical protein
MIANADNTIRFELSLYDGDDFILGKTVPASVRRLSDGKFLKADDTWQVAYITRDLTELTGNDNVKGSYFLDLLAQPTDDVYFFRAFHTFAGETKPDVWELQTDAESPKLAADGVDGINVDGINLRQAAAVFLAALAGELAGNGTATVVLKTPDGATTRITAAIDGQKDRTAITLNVPA